MNNNNDVADPELDSLLAPFAGRGSDALLPTLHAIHDQRGWCSPAAARAVGALLDVPLADIHGVLDFYALFYREPVGRRILRICGDVPCALAGGAALLAACGDRLGLAPGATSADGAYTLERAPCLGLCHAAPAALVNTTPHGYLAAADLDPLLNDTPAPLPTAIGGDVLVCLDQIAAGAPLDLAAYEAAGGMAGLRKARSLPPAAVVAEVKAAGLVGRGGAAFPTGLKWELTAANPAPRYLVVNADESEPGAFKDRVLLEGAPLRLLEGVLIACHAVGVERAFVYVRGEYALAYERLAAGVAALAAAGYLAGLAIEIRRGAGAYICGEETALMESIEGRRGFPRVKPPFPNVAGLWGRPTVINNVETLAAIPAIIDHGAAWYAALGSPASGGTKLIAVSGHVRRPGVYEVAFGTPLRAVIERWAGGVPDDRPIAAVLSGGAAGKFLRGDQLDVPLDFKAMAAAGGSIGAGTLIVFDESVDLRAVLECIAHFFADESCGKCFPCQLGTQRQLEIMHRVAHGAARPADRITLIELGQTMTDTSLCGLGQTAAMALLSALDRWPDLLEGR